MHSLQGTSRGGADLKEIVRKIDLWGLTHLYVVGGNGGNAAANAINNELEAAGVVCSVIGVPKSIDNDILLVSDHSFVTHQKKQQHVFRHRLGASNDSLRACHACTARQDVRYKPDLAVFPATHKQESPKRNTTILCQAFSRAFLMARSSPVVRHNPMWGC